MAHAMDDPSKKFIEFVDGLEVPEASYTYNDITGKSAAHVIAILKSIVNNREGPYGYIKGNIFTFKINGQQTISFTLEAYPTTKQPGNGRMQTNGIGRRYKTLTKKLFKQYKNDTETFAKEMKRVFKDNSRLLECENEILQDVYILLLFEVGRRLVDDENLSEGRRTAKEAYDSLPISGAITKIVKLFDMKRCSFNDVFHPDGQFHCFTGSPGKREDAINKLKSNEKYEDIKALFYGEEAEESSADAASEGKVSSYDAEVRELSRVLSKLEVLPQKESKKPSKRD